jgi:hypothetical protein
MEQMDWDWNMELALASVLAGGLQAGTATWQ